MQPRPGDPAPDRTPLVVGVDMGYGHRRPAVALAEALGVEMLSADRPPLAEDEKAGAWNRWRWFYEWATRWSGVPVLGAPLRPLVDGLTNIASLHPARDLSKPGWAVRRLAREIGDGLGHNLVEHLRATGRPLLTTYFVPAHAADAAGLEHIHCVVTDSDIHRVWAPLDPAASRIQYLVPSRRARRRLLAYGVAPGRIQVTGYPLPGALVGGEDLAALKRNLAGRLVRLDPHHAFRDTLGAEVRGLLGPLPEDQEGRAPLLTFAVGGAGAQKHLPREFLPGLRASIEAGRLRVALVAGVREDVEAALRAAVVHAGLAPHLGDAVRVLRHDTFEAYFQGFNDLLATTDILWTKPSELTFFGALGLALVLAPPVGIHERYNRRWARESGAGLKQRDARHAGHWLAEWLEDGQLAGAAWSGCTRLPARGLYRILEQVAHAGAPAAAPNR